FLGSNVLPVQLDEPLPSHSAEPRVKSYGRVFHVVGQATIGLREHVLNHVGRINTRGQTPVHSDTNHFPQAVPVPIRRELTHRMVTEPNSVQEGFRIRLILGHVKSPKPIPSNQSKR